MNPGLLKFIDNIFSSSEDAELREKTKSIEFDEKMKLFFQVMTNLIQRMS